MRKTPLDRFSEKYTVKDNGCWEWTGVLGGSDFKYGYIYSNVYKRKIPATRFSYELFIGIIPDGHNVKLKCNSQLCVNPEHLFSEEKILNPNGQSRFKDYVKVDTEKGQSAGKKRFIVSVKITAGCTDCRSDFFEFPSVFDFDHRDGEIKLFNICGASSRPWNEILNEMMKCDVVCSTCHRIRTAKRNRKVVS